jgi:hypothetical protein
MNRTRRLSGLASALLLVLTAACAGAATSDPFRPRAAGREGPVLLTVDNQDFRDASIFVNWTGTRMRVGSVTGKTRNTFEMTWRDYQMWIEVDFLGGGELKTGQSTNVLPGDHIDFIIIPGW